MKIRKIDLAVQQGCIGCSKDCNWRAATVVKGFKAVTKVVYGCNSGK